MMEVFKHMNERDKYVSYQVSQMSLGRRSSNLKWSVVIHLIMEIN